MLPGLALHADVGPDDRFGAALGFMLGMTATTGGYAVPEGGARSLAEALIGCLRASRRRAPPGRPGGAGGRPRAAALRAVRLGDGEEIAARVVLADTDVAALLLDLVEREHVPSPRRRLHAALPARLGNLQGRLGPRRPGAVGGRAGPGKRGGPRRRQPRRPLAVHRAGARGRVARPSLPGHRPAEPARSHAGRRRVATRSGPTPGCRRVLDGGWGAQAEPLGDRIDARIEGLAPGFRARILARRVVSPDQLQAMDANLVGGDLGGGSNAWHRQLLFRPLFPYFRYRMPVAGLYLCSSYAHPGAGVHGMCGYNAAQRVLNDLA